MTVSPTDRQEAAMLLFAIIDSMLDEVYPLLDLYGDALEGLEYMMMKADGERPALSSLPPLFDWVDHQSR